MPAPDYILSLRKKIGNDLLFVPSASVLIFDKNNRVLLVRAKESCRWQTVGGLVDPFEAPSDAAVRECWEETGLFVRLTGLAGVFGGPAFEATYPNGDRSAFVNTTFFGEIISGEAEPDQVEIDEIGWFADNDMPDLKASAATKIIVGEGFRSRRSPYFTPPTWSPDLHGR